jgi:hypothetical protein
MPEDETAATVSPKHFRLARFFIFTIHDFLTALARQSVNSNICICHFFKLSSPAIDNKGG